MEFLQNYYTTPISNNVPVEHEVSRINTVIKLEKDEVQSSSSNHIYQNIQEGQPRENVWTIPFLLEIPKSKELQPTDLEVDFLIDSQEQNQTLLTSLLGMKSKRHTQF